MMFAFYGAIIGQNAVRIFENKKEFNDDHRDETIRSHVLAYISLFNNLPCFPRCATEPIIREL